MNRKTFLIAVAVYWAVATLGSWLLQAALSDHAPVTYLVSKSGLQFALLAALTPFAIFRLRDIQATWLWVVFFWLDALFGIRNVLLVQELYGIKIDPLSVPVGLASLTAFVLLVVLLVKPGIPSSGASPNKRSQRSAQSAPAAG